MIYDIVLGADKLQLIHFVNKFCREGWTPLGAPFENFDPETYNGVRWCQAMVKSE